MNPLTGVVLLACLAFSAAQLGAYPAGGGSLDGGVGGGTGNWGGLLANALGAGSGSGSGSGTGAATGSNPMSQLFRNPMLNYGMMGGENMNRAFMLPFLSNMPGTTNTAKFSYLRGGMDRYFSTMMADMFGQMMAKSTGMNPMMARALAGPMVDAPDNYLLNHFLFSGALGRGSQGSQSQGTQSQGSGQLPLGAANANQQSSTGGMFGGSLAPLLLSSMFF